MTLYMVHVYSDGDYRKTDYFWTYTINVHSDGDYRRVIDFQTYRQKVTFS